MRLALASRQAHLSFSTLWLRNLTTKSSKTNEESFLRLLLTGAEPGGEYHSNKSMIYGYYVIVPGFEINGSVISSMSRVLNLFRWLLEDFVPGYPDYPESYVILLVMARLRSFPWSKIVNITSTVTCNLSNV